MRKDKVARRPTVERKGNDGLPPYTFEDITQVPAENPETRASEPLSSPTSEISTIPSYTPSVALLSKPIAIPQRSPTATSPFLLAYPPSLLAYGITKNTWNDMLMKLSSFLCATSGMKAKSHASDVLSSAVRVPIEHGKAVARHAASLESSMSSPTGAVGTIGSGVALISHATFGAVGAICSLPFMSVLALTKKPQTAKQRLAAALKVLNRDLFHARGLKIQLVETEGLAEVGLNGQELMNLVRNENNMDAESKMKALNAYLADVKLDSPQQMSVGEKTCWLVVNKHIQS